jgi:flagellar hook protein FlgE
MGIYSMMRTSASGMAAQANRLGTVADNIANVNTTGYKRAATEFSSLILESGTAEYVSGGVESRIRHAISEQGSFKFTTSSTDLAVKGDGFFVVSDSAGQPFLTRAGSFVRNADGDLVNAAGFKLMAYQLSGGTPSIVTNGTAGLEAVNRRLVPLLRRLQRREPLPGSEIGTRWLSSSRNDCASLRWPP